MTKRSARVICIKTKKIFNIYCIDVDKVLNTFLDIIMMSLDLYE